jgi:hypothetical protein
MKLLLPRLRQPMQAAGVSPRCRRCIEGSVQPRVSKAALHLLTWSAWEFDVTPSRPRRASGTHVHNKRDRLSSESGDGRAPVGDG